MPYEVDLTVEDTTSLLGLVNSTNPTTIGELLTFDKIDIQDFVKNKVVNTDRSTFIVAQDIYDSKYRYFGATAEVSSYYNTTLELINAAMTAPGGLAVTPLTQARINAMTSLVKIGTGPTTVETNPLYAVWPFDPSSGEISSPYAWDSTKIRTLLTPTDLPLSACDRSITIQVKTSDIKEVPKISIGLSNNKQPTGLAVGIWKDKTADMIGEVTLGSTVLRYLQFSYQDQLKIENGAPMVVSVSWSGTLIVVMMGETRYVVTKSAAVLAYLAGAKFYPYFQIGDKHWTMFVKTRLGANWGNMTLPGWGDAINVGGESAPKYIKVGSIQTLDALGLDTSSASKHGSASGLSGQSTAKLVNRSYIKDHTSVTYDRVALTDLIVMPVTDPAWSWYDSSEWNQTRDIPLALQMFKDNLAASGIDVSKVLRNLNVSRVAGDAGSWYLHFTFDSYVLKDLEFSKFKMPSNFSDVVTTALLNGFIYMPLQQSAVIN